MRIPGIHSLALALLALAASGAAPSTAPTTQQTLAELREAARKEFADHISGLPTLPDPRTTGELFTLAIDKEGALIIRPKIGKTERSRVEVIGLAGPAVIMVLGDQANTPEGTSCLQFENNDFSRGDEVFRRTQLFASAASMQIAVDTETMSGSHSVSLIQAYTTDEPDQATRLYVQTFAPVSDDLKTRLNLTAPSFVELRKRYPLETRQYLDPMLRDLGQASSILAPDVRITLQVFAGHAKPDVELSRKIDQALAMFDAEDFKVRRNASKALADLGAPAALVLARADRTGWSIERSNGVDAFLAQVEGQAPAEVAKLKSDPAFLLDCLYSDDAATRAGAAAELAKLIHKPVTIQPNADPVARAALIDRLCPLLLKPSTNPTSQP